MKAGDWVTTFERIEAMIQNPANHVKPVQMIIGKGKR